MAEGFCLGGQAVIGFIGALSKEMLYDQSLYGGPTGGRSGST